MRLSPTEQQVIRQASLPCFGVRPRLFGSGLNDSRLGEAIDLHLEAPVTPKQGGAARLRMVADIWKQLAAQKSEALITLIDQFVVRFTKLQDTMGAHGLRSQRAMRNTLAREWPEPVTWPAQALNRAQSMGLPLIDWLTRLRDESERRKK